MHKRYRMQVLDKASSDSFTRLHPLLSLHACIPPCCMDCPRRPTSKKACTRWWDEVTYARKYLKSRPSAQVEGIAQLLCNGGTKVDMCNKLQELVSEGKSGGGGTQGVIYTRSMNTGWKPPAKIRMQSEDQRQAVREKFHIIVDGHNLPPAVTEFRDTKLPPAVLRVLERKGIKKPTPIQMQVVRVPSF